MALYQPTNIIPSSYTKGTVDAVNDKMEISWQVNGNSAMTAFQIDFYLNDANSTPVTSTGKKGITPEEQKQLGLPFYGTDRFGRPQFFTWNANVTWEDKGFTNGNEYKYKITQWYKAQTNVMSGIPDIALHRDMRYYFKLYGREGYVVFRTPDTAFSWNGARFYYNVENKSGWFIETNNTQINLINYKYVSTIAPPSNATDCGTMTKDNEASLEDFIIQNTFSIFNTKNTPILILYSAPNSDYGGTLTAFTNEQTFNKTIGYFVADYSQVQRDSIRWIRWQVATATYNSETERWILGEILQDTGDIYTPTLNFEFNGFFNGRSYAIRCFGESESGQTTFLRDASTDGWFYFSINIENQRTFIGNFVADCLHKENAVQLSWTGNDIVPTILPTNYSPKLVNGNINLQPNSSVSWNRVNFAPEWSLAYKLIMQGVVPTEFGGIPTQENVVESHRVIVLNARPNYQVTYSYSAENAGEVVVSVTGATATSTVDKINKQVTVTFPNPLGTAINATVTITAHIFKYVETQTFDGVVTEAAYRNSTNVLSYTLTPNGNTVTATIYGNTTQAVEVRANISYQASSVQGNLLNIENGNIILSGNNNNFSLKANNSELTSFTAPEDTYSLVLLITPTAAEVFYYGANSLINTQSLNISYTQQNINSVTISGGAGGVVVGNVSVYQGDGSDVISLYNSPSFEPVWNNIKYALYATANFDNGLNAGLSVAEGRGFRVYREEIGRNTLTPIARTDDTVNAIKDFGIQSRKAYKYYLYAYDSNNNYMTSVEAQNTIATCFKNYSLLVCDYDEDKDEYHVRKQYLFALNLSTGSVGNNNSPTLNANFTRYPTRMPSTQNYASGTLQGLIGVIYTVPALIEQIGNYKWTAKPSTLDYFDSVDLEQELYDLSTAPYQLFLRDMKGRLRMIATNSAITMTTNIKQKQQSISISFPWVEIGNASDVTIIQTPQDYGWNNDNQVLNVSLDVDVETGELSATYPYPYNGTKFYLTGVNKENLTAKTPLGITPAQFELSEVAEEPNDGELNATVKVNSEDN